MASPVASTSKVPYSAEGPQSTGNDNALRSPGLSLPNVPGIASTSLLGPSAGGLSQPETGASVLSGMSEQPDASFASLFEEAGASASYDFEPDFLDRMAMETAADNHFASEPSAPPTPAGLGSTLTLDDQAKLKELEDAERQIEAAIQANAEYQEQMLAARSKLVAAYERADDLHILSKNLVEAIDVPHQLEIVSTHLQNITLPWFKHYHNKELPDTDDTQKLARYAKAIRPVIWTKEEKKLLKSHAEQHAERATFNQGLARETLTLHEESAVMDWDQVAGHKGLGNHTASDCRIHWLNSEHPKLNTKTWTKDEVNKLHSVVADHEEKDWVTIADALGTGRSVATCLRQYRKKPLQKKDWQPEEDNRLREAMSMFGANWQSVARHVGRTSNQCINRWTKTLKPGIKRGKWSKEEDDMLKAAVDACGTVWKKVGLRVRGRTDQQCRERWSNVLDPRVRKKNWTAEEDEIIMQQFNELGPRWADISKVFNGKRTDNAVFRRYEELVKAENPKPARKKKEKDPNAPKKPKPIGPKAPPKPGAKKRGRPRKIRPGEEVQPDGTAATTEGPSQSQPAAAQDEMPDDIVDQPPAKRPRRTTRNENAVLEDGIESDDGGLLPATDEFMPDPTPPRPTRNLKIRLTAPAPPIDIPTNP